MEKRGVFVLISLLFWLIGLSILLTAPFGSYPDEQSHYNYARHIRSELSLPPIDYSGKQLIPESFQPPLFYIVAGLVYTPALSDEWNIHAMRFVSLLFGWLTIWVTWKSASLTFPARPEYALLAASFVAFNAQFLFIHTGISNISLASFLGGLTVLLALTILLTEQKSARLSLYLGLAFGGAILSRIACIYLLPICGGVLLYIKWMEEKSFRAFFQSTILFIAGAMLVSGWWFLRNWISYDDPIFWKFHQEVIGKGFTRTEPLTAGGLLVSGIYLNASFWAFFGKQEYHAGIAEYSIYFLFQALAIVGTLHLLFSKARLFPKRGFATLCAASLTAIAIVLWIQTQISAPQGRYFFMAMCPIAIVLAGGLLQLVSEPARKKAAIALSVFQFILCIYLLLRYWFPRSAAVI